MPKSSLRARSRSSNSSRSRKRTVAPLDSDTDDAFTRTRTFNVRKNVDTTASFIDDTDSTAKLMAGAAALGAAGFALYNHTRSMKTKENASTFFGSAQLAPTKELNAVRYRIQIDDSTETFASEIKSFTSKMHEFETYMTTNGIRLEYFKQMLVGRTNVISFKDDKGRREFELILPPTLLKLDWPHSRVAPMTAELHDWMQTTLQSHFQSFYATHFNLFDKYEENYTIKDLNPIANFTKYILEKCTAAENAIKADANFAAKALTQLQARIDFWVGWLKVFKSKPHSDVVQLVNGDYVFNPIASPSRPQITKTLHEVIHFVLKDGCDQNLSVYSQFITQQDPIEKIFYDAEVRAQRLADSKKNWLPNWATGVFTGLASWEYARQNFDLWDNILFYIDIDLSKKLGECYCKHFSNWMLYSAKLGVDIYDLSYNAFWRLFHRVRVVDAGTCPYVERFKYALSLTNKQHEKFKLADANGTSPENVFFDNRNNDNPIDDTTVRDFTTQTYLNAQNAQANDRPGNFVTDALTPWQTAKETRKKTAGYAKDAWNATASGAQYAWNATTAGAQSVWENTRNFVESLSADEDDDEDNQPRTRTTRSTNSN